MSVWQFTGQGSQYLNMGNEYKDHAVFQRYWHHCEKIALKFDIHLSQLASNEALIHQTQYSQPLIFAYEYALGMSLLQSSPPPQCIIGHSIGEYAAYVISNMIDLPTALQLIILRGALIGSLPLNTSGMLAVIGPYQKTIDSLSSLKKIDLAAINHAQQVVFSGPLDALNDAKNILKSQGIKSIALNVSHGFHSHCMDPILDEFHEKASHILSQTSNPSISVISTTTGQPLNTLNPDYLKNHIRYPVNYWPVAQSLMNHPSFLEIGPKPILTKLLQKEPITAKWARLE